MSFNRPPWLRNTVSRREGEADDRQLTVGNADHAGRIVRMGLPVDVFRGLEDPVE